MKASPDAGGRARPAHVPAPAPGHVPAPAPDSAQRRLSLELYRLRLERGLSLRELARLMGYSAHSVFVDVEKGRRLPSESLLTAYEKRFELPTDSLLRLRRQALVERADQFTGGLFRPPEPAPAPSAPPTPPPAPPESDWPERAGQFASTVARLLGEAIGLVRERYSMSGSEPGEW